jgi:hypothetical protein
MPCWIIGTVVTGGTLSTAAVVTIGVVLCVTCAEEDTDTVAGCGAVSVDATVTCVSSGVSPDDDVPAGTVEPEVVSVDETVTGV